ncbi:MAG: DUF4373 domain-containing protein [Lachnospiraceae bacterium]|nr:DUF4373 domain-containing protein [Lachnospiraceae bacterium]
MSGIPKVGIDYAGWAVDIFDNDTKIDKLLDSKGWIGFSVYFFLCMKAYGTEGYFYKWCYDDCASTARKMGSGISASTVKETVDYCLQISLFDKRRFVEWGILTSKGIQRRYWNVVRNRRVKKVYLEFWLLGDHECSGLVKVNLKEPVTDAESHLQSANEDVQMGNANKVKYSKVNNNIVAPAKQGKDDKEKMPTDFELKCVDYLIQCVLSDFPNQKVPKSLKEKGKWTVHIKRMMEIDNITPSDIWNTLVWTMKDSFWRTNIRSTKKFREKYATLYLQSKQRRNTSGNKFNTFENQREYDYEALERELLAN